MINRNKNLENLIQSNAISKSSITIEPVKHDGVRPCVEWFATMMELKLQKNDHKSGWQDMDSLDLLHGIEDEFSELANAILGDLKPEQIIQECADVANYAMMIADNMRRKLRK